MWYNSNASSLTHITGSQVSKKNPVGEGRAKIDK